MQKLGQIRGLAKIFEFDQVLIFTTTDIQSYSAVAILFFFLLSFIGFPRYISYKKVCLSVGWLAGWSVYILLN